MSGGAGKVYFVLYLAVVLELLIIIVERDEAEEGLLKKQRETMKIVESILSQLQSGAGTEGINTKPQDEITIPPAGVNIEDVLGTKLKSFRKYIVEVGVTDVTTDLIRKEGEPEKEYNERLKKLVELSNVDQIEYQVFFNPDDNPDKAPPFPTEDMLKEQGVDINNLTEGDIITAGDGNNWRFRSSRKLNLDKKATYDNLELDHVTAESIIPVYPPEDVDIKGPSFVPQNMPDDSVFYYSNEDNAEEGELIVPKSNEKKKRAFVINFQPPNEAGWYKLRFASKTNKILGVRVDQVFNQLDEETTVNIGTVQLTVRDLLKVKKELTSQLEKFGLPSIETLIDEEGMEKFNMGLDEAKATARKKADEPTEVVGKMDLYGYICRLLAPGKSRFFEQNLGAIEFDIRVITPQPKIAEPTITLPQEYVGAFDAKPPVMEFVISPYQGDANKVTGRVEDATGARVAGLILKAADEIANSSYIKPGSGGKRWYRATVDQKLTPGRYDIVIQHGLMNKSAEGKAVLEVFPTGLTDENDRITRLTVGANAAYGKRVRLDAQPSSSGKMKSSQFRTYLYTDLEVGDQIAPFRGISMPVSDALAIPADANKLFCKIEWEDPITGETVKLFPRDADIMEVEITQSKPRIRTGNLSTSVIGNEKNLKIRIDGITLKDAPVGTDRTKKAKNTFKVGDVEVSVKGFKLGKEPVVEPSGEGYRITVDLTGSMERGKKRISGDIKVKVSAFASNPLNGKVSEPDTDVLNIPISFVPEASGRRGGRSGGGKPAGGGNRRRR